MRKIINKYPDGLEYDFLDSPVGKLTLIVSYIGLVALLCEKDLEAEDFDKHLKRFRRNSESKILKKTRAQLEEYFAGERKKFDLPIDFIGTEFQKSVWKELLKVPFGETRTYSEQAGRLGDVKKVRAVAGANGKNPISIIAPCHRVIGKDGSLTGFAGGLEMKKWLLDHEQKVSN